MSKTVLVTGSSRGIGAAIANRLARDGFDLVLHCRTGLDQARAVAESVKALGRSVRIVQFDVADRAAVAAVLADDIDQYGAYYGVVCNAGVTRDTAFPAMTEADWDQVVHTNLDGFYNVLQPLIMPMIRRRQPGRIVVMSSVSGVMGNRGQVNYSAAKAGLIGAAKALALELAKRKITVNCVAPGLIDTEMVSAELAEQALKMIPAQRLGQVQEVAAAVAYLMSEEAGYVTRQVLNVNGGLC